LLIRYGTQYGVLDTARAENMMVPYTLIGGPNPTPTDMVDQGLAPRPDEWVVQGGPDKFLGLDLEKRLRDNGFKTVILTAPRRKAPSSAPVAPRRSVVTSCRGWST
jgi:hypothetical protein